MGMTVSFDNYRLIFIKPQILFDYWYSSAVAENGFRYYYFIEKKESDGQFHLDLRKAEDTPDASCSDLFVIEGQETHKTLDKAKRASNRHFKSMKKEKENAC